MPPMEIAAFAGVSKQLRITGLTLDGVTATPAMSGLTVDYVLTDGSADLDNGTLVHDDATPGTWTADITVPDIAPAVCHVHLTATRGLSVGKWHGTIRVHAFA